MYSQDAYLKICCRISKYNNQYGITYVGGFATKISLKASD
jgi:hypothetical protein